MTTYQRGDLVWAKMKGFPPWPAKILQPSTQLTDVPANRYSVMFFGTNETAIMKNTDLFSYLQHRAQFEVSRKQKSVQKGHVSSAVDDDYTVNGSGSIQGFAEAVHEIRIAAGLDEKKPDSLFGSFAKRSPSPPSSILPTNRGINYLIGDASFSPMLCDGALTSLLDGLETDVDVDSHTKSSKRLQKQKAFEEFISSVRSPSRERSASTSSSCRMRLFSEMSDVFDELLESVQFSPAELLSAIDNLPSEEERPATPEEPLPMPAPTKRCSYCGCECELFGLKWRCTGKSCLKWNGAHNPYGSGDESTDSTLQNMDALVPSTSAEPLGSTPHLLAGKTQPKLEEESPPTLNRSFLNGSERSTNWASIDVCLPTPSLLQHNSATNQQAASSVQNASLLPSCSSGPCSRTLNLQPCPLLPQSIAANGKPILPRRQLGTGRPKSYKVEKTPPVSENGQRHCAFCGGQVRPQMCGGNKHRWRCVDKKCRKWYGWVRSNEEIPKDLGKKGRWKDLALKIKAKSDNPEGSSHSGSVRVPHSQNAYIAAALPLCEKSSKKVGRPPKGNARVKLEAKKRVTVIASENDTRTEVERAKRKYTKRDSRLKEDISRQSSRSPLPPEVMCWEASAMEQRCRWWTSEKRRQEMSPEREWSSQALDVAAAMRLIGHAMNAAANTRADEPGTVSGTLDLLMDALMSSLGPMLSLTAQVPQFNIDSATVQRLWNASAVHTPLFPS
ncbi:unnamed protein product [Toxocara canis]|uniref:PWWP domain-containing protein n=1 Tax=Toxocara canis TaxID=6265 RepID=A0A183USN4_TOXCA|nr:unnamed protein product [Toxocara canis]